MDFLFVYTYIYLHMSIYYHMYISIYLFVFSHDNTVDRPSHSQCVLNRLPHAAHTTSDVLLFVIHSCVLINRRNSIYLYQMFSIWLCTIGIHEIIQTL